jgi:hypothetical protein
MREVAADPRVAIIEYRSFPLFLAVIHLSIVPDFPI